ncbi:hypothetical protein F441_11090 [Phytophthora nicotianae CJ01A1]|uniref:Uncharacterized protein n=2 Tax=Phytophthora nicotianae TaxID=4792 RepID=W2WU82_PHYNI|nr:hypothetical protein L915_10889 [Phytophthora nicotianae]ETP13897.1 hypothetical protein F441_11090 [Phytophthora nicotianae CJ01A1]
MVLETVSRSQSAESEWLTHDELLQVQQEAMAWRDPSVPLRECCWDGDQRIYRVDTGQVWIPSEADDM